MGRKKQGKYVRPDNKGKDKRHKMKGKSLEAFTDEMHSAFEGNHNYSYNNAPAVLCLPLVLHVCYKTCVYLTNSNILIVI